MLTLPATPKQVAAEVIAPMFYELLPGKFDGSRARIQVLAIMMQESSLETRQQRGGGPAHGLAQFERSGIEGVLKHPLSARFAQVVCAHRGCEPLVDAVYDALLSDDILCAAFARLNLWTDPHPLPEIGDATSAWAMYQRVWRPGKPRDQDWPMNYRSAVAAVMG